MKLLNKLFAVSILAALYSPTYAQAYVDETHCMALNIYHEAKNQSMIGQIAVGLVTMNRVRDHRYPNTVCEVVYQGPSRPSWKDPNKRIPIRHKCQFSWYCDGKSDKARDQKAWWKAIEYARIVMSYRILDVTEGATHYHATYVSPNWAPQLDLVGRIGTHIFYRWP